MYPNSVNITATYDARTPVVQYVICNLFLSKPLSSKYFSNSSIDLIKPSLSTNELNGIDIAVGICPALFSP